MQGSTKLCKRKKRTKIAVSSNWTGKSISIIRMMCTMITESKQPTWILRRLTSSLGAIILHGPHQSAKKSTTTNLSVCSLLLKSSCNIKWDDWIICSITLQCWGVFRYPYHPTCRMLNFWLLTVWCWKIQELVCFTLKFACFLSKCPNFVF